MGSHGTGWLRCEWCRRWGKCLCHLPDGVAPLTDIDGIGLLCDSCYDRSCPPHYDYVERILVSKLGGTTEPAHTIANFAYPVCATEHFWWLEQEMERRLSQISDPVEYVG